MHDGYRFLLMANRISREDLSELIGTTLYTVSRILSKWEQQGLVKSGRERLAIISNTGIERIGYPSNNLDAFHALS